ncbi:ZP domain-containing protein-like [Diadema setosum]|uniref:ZP domain-containing protein-like n=1 Tax=Diadema setosum TaxID=31175 RepID=UPI003B3BB5B4
MVVHLNDELFFQASSDYSHLDLSIEACKATNGESYEATESYEFISNWEVAEDETAVTCEDSSFIDTLEVETRAFRFLDGDVDQVIYIHCDLFVCDRDVENSACKEACNDGYSTSQPSSRRRRAADYAPPPLPVQRVTRGPIRIVRDTQSNQVDSEYHGDIQPSTSPLWGFAMLAMGSVVIVLLAALVVTLRKLGNTSSRGGGKTDEEETVGLMGK